MKALFAISHAALMPAWLLCASPLYATGSFPPGPAVSGTDAIAADALIFTGWAKSVTSLTLGPQATGTNNAPANYGTAYSALGASDAAGADYESDSTSPVLSLGEGGQITLRFSPAIVDGEGSDFAVFENGFSTFSGKLFAELAFVEVSSDGVNFIRFPAISCTPVTTQLPNLGSIDPANLHNLAGKHPAGYGTPFDLAELAGTPGLDTTRITRVRIVDVVGDVTNGSGSLDSLGNVINDPWPTDFQTSGFDLDAVGVIHASPDPWAAWLEENFDATQRTDPAITSADADPDGDGKTNLVEFACGFLPTTPEPVPALTIRHTAAGVELEYRQHTGRDAQVMLERLTETGSATVTAAAAVTGDPIQTRTVTLPVAAARGLFRLKVVW